MQQSTGNLVAMLRELAGLNFRLTEPADITLMAQAGAAAADLLSSTPPVTLQPGYEYYFYGISGAIQDPATSPIDFPRIDININDSYRKGNWFDTPKNLSTLVSTLGHGPIQSWLPAFFKCPERTQLQAVPTRSLRDPTWAGATKQIAINLWGLKIRV